MIPAGVFLLWALTAIWAVVAVRTRSELARAPRLRRSRPSNERGGGPLPLVSVLLPARDEADRMLDACVSSLLAQDYPRLEVIAVDDRSRDNTAGVLRALAAGDARLTVVSGCEPPLGWVGKQWALTQAARRARGEWLLTVDADALYDPDVISDALREAERSGLDALSLLPRVGTGDWGVSITYPVGFWALLLAAPFGRVNAPGTATGLAWGGFFLVRHGVWEQIGGWAPVKSETSEDTKTAALLKRRGFRFRVVLGADRVFTPMYPRFADLWYGTMKNVYAGPIATPLIALANTFFCTVPAALAVASLVLGVPEWAVPAFLTWALQIAAILPVYRLHRIPRARAVFGPVGALIASAQMLCATWRVVVTGEGIPWRGRRVRARTTATVPPPPPRQSSSSPVAGASSIRSLGRPRSPR